MPMQGMFAAILSQQSGARPQATASEDLDPTLTTLRPDSRLTLLCRSDGSEPEGEAVAAHAVGPYWIVGRARLDGRRELRDRLAATGLHEADRQASDLKLCLQAYVAWSEGFTKVLAGDFSFVLWDGRNARLLAMRDQLGGRRLFHTTHGGDLLISDSLSWLVERTKATALDDYWIADFLCAGFCREFSRTAYRDIARLPPGHLLTAGAAPASWAPYWKLELAEPLRLASAAAYAEQFRALLRMAIEDRLPRGNVGISMSGGLDSTTLAASAVNATADASRIKATCYHYQSLIHCDEDRFARVAARHLGIELWVRPADDVVYDPEWRVQPVRFPEPTVTAFCARPSRQIAQEMSAISPIWFEGEGPDNALTLDRDAFVSWLIGRRAWPDFLRAIGGYAMVKGLDGWRESVRRWTARVKASESAPSMPAWLAPDWSASLHLEDRIRTLGDGGRAGHPWHPVAFESLTSPIWQHHFDGMRLFECFAPMVWRSPYLDLRVLTFMLSVPPLPWGWRKHLMRRAMQSRLPDGVLRRDKTPLRGLPHVAALRRHGLPDVRSPGGLARYVVVDRLPSLQKSDVELDQAMRAHVLDQWLAP